MRRLISRGYWLSGVYEIENLKTGKRYIGSSQNIEGRFHQHQMSLLAGNHHCKDLQHDFDKGNSFRFNLLYVEVVKPNCADHRYEIYAAEKRYMNSATNLYNTNGIRTFFNNDTGEDV